MFSQTFLQRFWFYYALFVLFNMRDIFLMFSTFEPYTGAKYSILGFEIVFETLGLIILAFIIISYTHSIQVLQG